MMLESPSRRRHNATMKSLAGDVRRSEAAYEKAIDIKARSNIKGRLDRLRKEYDVRKNFFDMDKHLLGVPWLCSGLMSRTKDNGRLDFALIEMNADRVGENLIPDRIVWGNGLVPSRTLRGPEPFACNKLMEGIEPFKNASDLENVHKLGARTGASDGRFSHIKSDVRMEWDEELGLSYSEEYSFFGGNDFFSLPEDSGSFVFTSYGAWLGLLFGGATKREVPGQAVTYVTDAEALLEHMHDLSNKTTRFELATF